MVEMTTRSAGTMPPAPEGDSGDLANIDAQPLGRRSAEERAALGKAARASAPLEAHAEFRRADDVDPVALLLGQAETRLPELVPIRHGRMLVSPFTFYRGAALIMAADLAGTPVSPLGTQLCGDAHLSNFGGYASPERRLVFDINDFDETYPGPFEWDVKRLAASFAVAGRDNGFTTEGVPQGDRDRRRELPDRDPHLRRRSPSSPSGTPTSTSRTPSPGSRRR